MKTQKHGVELGEGPGEKKTFFRNLLLTPLMMSFLYGSLGVCSREMKNILLYAEYMTQAN